MILYIDLLKRELDSDTEAENELLEDPNATSTPVPRRKFKRSQESFLTWKHNLEISYYL